MFTIFSRKKNKSNVRIKSLNNFSKKSETILEEYSKLHHVIVTSRTLEIGAYSYMRGGRIEEASKIGRFCSIGLDVKLGVDPSAHPINHISTSNILNPNYISASKPLQIGHDVWIGHGAIVMANITIGNGSIIAAGAVVTKSVPPYTIVAGVPARQIGKRFEASDIDLLLESEWWNFSISAILNADSNAQDITEFCQKLIHSSERAVYSKIKIKNRGIRNIDE